MLRASIILMTLPFGALIVGCASGEEMTAAPTVDTPPPAATARSAPTVDPSLCEVAEFFCVSPAALESAGVVEIIDGDTLDVRLGNREERVRIFGIDTPERGERCFAESSMALEALSGARVRLRADVRERDRAGRLLRYLYTADGMSIDAMMIAGGMAYAWTRDGALRDELVMLEARAKGQRRGCLWGD